MYSGTALLVKEACNAAFDFNQSQASQRAAYFCLGRIHTSVDSSLVS